MNLRPNIRKLFINGIRVLKTHFLNDMSRDIYLLNRAMADGMSRNCKPDDIVLSFSQFITDRANPYFEKHSSERSDRYFYHENKTEKTKMV